MNQNVDYGNAYEQRSIKMQTSNFDTRNQTSQIHGENYNRSFGDRYTPNNCGGRSSDMYNPEDHNSFYDRERFGNANNYTFIEQSLVNEQQLQEGKNRIDKLKEKLFTTSQKEKEEYEEKLRQRSHKKHSSWVFWSKTKSPEK